MSQSKKDIPFWYQRGKLKIFGRTDYDRKSAKIDIICHWIYKIILALAILLSIIYEFKN
jgi:hypothetical protein